MASTVPNSLKSADINRFALRGAQVEKAKPAVAYWCYYWVVQKIITDSLHNTDDESKAYTIALMDKLEQMKVNMANDDAVMDDIAGKALIEQFGLDIFGKADNAMRANKVSRQTADTFQAGATFLEVLGTWPPLDPEIAAKVKFAKYHALRIAKALKAGEDPNLTNPTPEPDPTEEAAPLDPNDPEVQALGGLGTQPGQPNAQVRQPSVEDVPDEHDVLEPTLARTSTHDESLHPSRAPSVPRPEPTMASHQSPPAAVESFYHEAADNGEVSPLGPASADQSASEGGGYFPRVPASEHSQVPVLPQPPPFRSQSEHNQPDSLDSPSAPPRMSPMDDHASVPFQQHLPSPGNSITSYLSAGVPHNPPLAPQTYNQGPVSNPIPPSQPAYLHHPAQPPSYTAASRAQPQAAYTPQENFIPDEEAIAKAQKHARWAISALNFEDVKTAVSELEGALKTLGAR